MNTQDEREAFEELPEIKGILQDGYGFNSLLNQYFHPDIQNHRLGCAFLMGAWMAYQARAKKLEGCVVVPKDKIEVWWQDAEEPENFATQSKDLHFIADGLEDGDIMKIHEHHTIHMPSNTLYGAWIYKDGERIFITGTKTDVEAARGGNE